MKQMQSAIREPNDLHDHERLAQTVRPGRALVAISAHPSKNQSPLSQGQDGTVGGRRNEDCLAIVGAVAPSRGQDFLLRKTAMREKTEQEKCHFARPSANHSLLTLSYFCFPQDASISSTTRPKCT